LILVLARRFGVFGPSAITALIIDQVTGKQFNCGLISIFNRFLKCFEIGFLILNYGATFVSPCGP